MSEITISQVNIVSVNLGMDTNNHIVQFQVTGSVATGLSNDDYVYVSAGSASNIGTVDNGTAAPGSAISIDAGAADTSASNLAFQVKNVSTGGGNTVFLLSVGGTSRLAQQSGQTATISGFKIKEATGAIGQTVKGGGAQYTEDDEIRFQKEGTAFDNSLNGYNFTFYHSGLNGSMTGSKQQSDLEANPSTTTYTGTYNAGSAPGAQNYYTFTNIVATAGNPNALFSGGPAKMLVFSAASGGGGGGGGSGKFTIKNTGSFKIAGSGKITIR